MQPAFSSSASSAATPKSRSTLGRMLRALPLLITGSIGSPRHCLSLSNGTCNPLNLPPRLFASLMNPTTRICVLTGSGSCALRRPIEHTIRIQNLSSSEVSLAVPDSLRFNFQSLRPTHRLLGRERREFSLDKGTHTVALPRRLRVDGHFQHLRPPAKGEPREIIPYLLIQNANNEFLPGHRVQRPHPNPPCIARLTHSPAKRTRPVLPQTLPGETFERPPSSSARSMVMPTTPATFFAAGFAPL